jgi:hypothetical protein
VEISTWVVERSNARGRTSFDASSDDVRALLLGVRQDLKLVILLLGVIAVMIGIVADIRH